MKIGESKLARLLGLGSLLQIRDAGNSRIVRRGNRAAAADLDPLGETVGMGNSWANQEYGAYYATSVPVYAAIKLRADAVSRPVARLYSGGPEGSRLPVASTHPVHQLLERVNP